MEKERINLIHDYHYTKVKEKDKKAYTSIMGKAFPELQEVSEGFHDSERGIISSRILGTFMHALNLGQMLIIFLGYFTIIRKYIGLKIYYVLATFILITIYFYWFKILCASCLFFIWGMCFCRFQISNRDL